MKASSENWSNSIKAFFLLAAILTAFSSGAAEVNSIVAKVGDASITSVELDRYVNPTLKSYMKMMPDDPQIREEYNLERVDALKGIIDSKLLVREANKLEFTIPPMEIDKQLSKERERYTSEEEFQAYLKENKITLQEFKEHLSDSIKAQAVLQEKVFKRVRVLPHEVHKFYVDNKNLLYSSQPSVHLYQILIKDDPSKEGRDPYARISDIKNQLASGANFQQLALMYSEGPMRASGGDWGIIEQGHFGEEMAAVESAAFTLAPGTYSDIIRTRFGYHIVYVSAKKDAHVQTEREAYDDIYRRVAESKSAAVYEPYMNGLRRSCAIEIFDPELMAAKPQIKPGKKIGDFMTRKMEEAESAPSQVESVSTAPVTVTETAEIKEASTPVLVTENEGNEEQTQVTESAEKSSEEVIPAESKEEGDSAWKEDPRNKEIKSDPGSDVWEKGPEDKTEVDPNASSAFDADSSVSETVEVKSEETKEEAEAANEKKEDVFVELKAAETNAETENPEVVKEDVFVELKAAEMKEETPAETKAAEPKEESKKADPFDELEKKMDQNMADPNLPGAQPSTDPPLFEMKEVSAPANN
ncbi:SurA N-terminal domain-containing protein [bacterium]|nr:SurA N-terminal domain-containing protein [bacterium]